MSRKSKKDIESLAKEIQDQEILSSSPEDDDEDEEEEDNDENNNNDNGSDITFGKKNTRTKNTEASSDEEDSSDEDKKDKKKKQKIKKNKKKSKQSETSSEEEDSSDEDESDRKTKKPRKNKKTKKSKKVETSSSEEDSDEDDNDDRVRQKKKKTNTKTKTKTKTKTETEKEKKRKKKLKAKKKKPETSSEEEDGSDDDDGTDSVEGSRKSKIPIKAPQIKMEKTTAKNGKRTEPDLGDFGGEDILQKLLFQSKQKSVVQTPVNPIPASTASKKLALNPLSVMDSQIEVQSGPSFDTVFNTQALIEKHKTLSLLIPRSFVNGNISFDITPKNTFATLLANHQSSNLQTQNTVSPTTTTIAVAPVLPLNVNNTSTTQSNIIDSTVLSAASSVAKMDSVLTSPEKNGLMFVGRKMGFWKIEQNQGALANLEGHKKFFKFCALSYDSSPKGWQPSGPQMIAYLSRDLEIDTKFIEAFNQNTAILAILNCAKLRNGVYQVSHVYWSKEQDQAALNNLLTTKIPTTQ